MGDLKDVFRWGEFGREMFGEGQEVDAPRRPQQVTEADLSNLGRRTLNNDGEDGLRECEEAAAEESRPGLTVEEVGPGLTVSESGPGLTAEEVSPGLTVTEDDVRARSAQVVEDGLDDRMLAQALEDDANHTPVLEELPSPLTASEIKGEGVREQIIADVVVDDAAGLDDGAEEDCESDGPLVLIDPMRPHYKKKVTSDNLLRNFEGWMVMHGFRDLDYLVDESSGEGKIVVDGSGLHVPARRYLRGRQFRVSSRPGVGREQFEVWQDHNANTVYVFHSRIIIR